MLAKATHQQLRWFRLLRGALGPLSPDEEAQGHVPSPPAGRQNTLHREAAIHFGGVKNEARAVAPSPEIARLEHLVTELELAKEKSDRELVELKDQLSLTEAQRDELVQEAWKKQQELNEASEADGASDSSIAVRCAELESEVQLLRAENKRLADSTESLLEATQRKAADEVEVRILREKLQAHETGETNARCSDLESQVQQLLSEKRSLAAEVEGLQEILQKKAQPPSPGSPQSGVLQIAVRCSELEAEVNQLEATNKSLSAQIHGLLEASQRKAIDEAELRLLRDPLQASEAGQQAGDLLELQARCEDLELQRRIADEEREAAQARCLKLQAEKTSLTTRLEVLAASRRGALDEDFPDGSEVQELKQKYATLEVERSTLQQRVAELEKLEAKARAAGAAASERVEAASGLLKEVADLQAMNSALRSELLGAASRAEELQSARVEAEAQRQRATDELRDRDAAAAKAHSSLAERCAAAEAERRTLQLELDALRMTHETLQSSWQDHSERREELSASHATIVEEHHQLSCKVTSLQHQLQAAEQERQGFATENSRLISQLKESELARSRWEGQVGSCKVELATAGEERQRLSEKVTQLESQLARSAAERDHWRAEAEKLLAQPEGSSSQNDGEMTPREWDHTASQKELQEAVHQQLPAQLSANRDALEDEVKRLKASLSATRREQDLLAEEVERLQLEAAAHEAGQRASQVELESLLQQVSIHLDEKQVFEAEKARLHAEVDALAGALQELSMRQARHAPSTPSAFAAAEQWALYEAGSPLEETAIIYSGGASLDLHELSRRVRLEPAQAAAYLRSYAKANLESGVMAKNALQAYQVFDPDHRGFLEWDNGEVAAFLTAVLNQQRLDVPDDPILHALFQKIDPASHGQLGSRDCLCLADAAARVLLLAAATVSQRRVEPVSSMASSGATSTSHQGGRVGNPSQLQLPVPRVAGGPVSPEQSPQRASSFQLPAPRQSVPSPTSALPAAPRRLDSSQQLHNAVAPPPRTMPGSSPVGHFAQFTR